MRVARADGTAKRRKCNMRAVIVTGGKQYIVNEQDKLDVERIPGDVGTKVTIDEVLLVGEGADVVCGTPTVPDAKVEATIIEQYRGKKVVVFKMKRRKSYRRKQGHRQELTKLKITKISVGKSAKKKTESDQEKPADKKKTAKATDSGAKSAEKTEKKSASKAGASKKTPAAKKKAAES